MWENEHRLLIILIQNTNMETDQLTVIVASYLEYLVSSGYWPRLNSGQEGGVSSGEVQVLAASVERRVDDSEMISNNARTVPIWVSTFRALIPMMEKRCDTVVWIRMMKRNI
jgi:hypothetical protein